MSQALTILNWQENLGSEDMPPEWMWTVDDELEIWFDEVKARREERYNAGSGDETPEMMSNTLVRKRR